MRKMPGLDPTTLPLTAMNAPVVGIGTPFPSGMTSQCGALYFKNKSNVGVNIVFDDGTSAEIPAWHARLFPMNKKSNQLWLSQMYVLPIASSPISQLDYEVYTASEDTTGLYTGPINYRTTIGNQLGTGQTFDAILELAAGANVDCTLAGTPQSFALTATGLNLAGVSAESPGYLVLGYIDSNNGRKTFQYMRGNKEQLFNSFSITVPGNTTGNLQTFALPSPANGLMGIVIFTLPSGVTIGDVAVKRAADPVGSFESIVPGTQNGNSLINLQNFFGPEGFTNFESSGGISVRFSSNNSNAGNASYTVALYGYQLAYDEVKVLVSYEDWNNNIYDLGWAIVGETTLLPLDFLVNIPITNPAQTNFGNIIFTVFENQIFYNTHYTFDVSIPCIVSFLSPD